MKRITIITALVTYLVLNLGISLKVHYCGESISFIDFFPIEKTSCCGGEKPSCCSDKLAFINPGTIQDNVKEVHHTFSNELICLDVPSKYAPLENSANFFEHPIQVEVQEVFFRPKVPLYLYNQVFRI